MGARHLRLTVRRVDGADQCAEIRLARPGRDPIRLRDLFAPKLAKIDAGFGIDALRLVAPEVEPLNPAQLARNQRESEAAKLADLLSSLGNRIGFENIVRLLPAESHIPERAQTIAVAAHSDPEPWLPTGRPPRPLTLFAPERLGTAPRKDREGPRGSQPPGIAQPNAGSGYPPAAFTWRGRCLTTARAHGPERLAPEWWLDDPNWRSGIRDYWRVETAEGQRLWLFCTPADPAGRAWYAQGAFA